MGGCGARIPRASPTCRHVGRWSTGRCHRTIGALRTARRNFRGGRGVLAATDPDPADGVSVRDTQAAPAPPRLARSVRLLAAGLLLLLPLLAVTPSPTRAAVEGLTLEA